MSALDLVVLHGRRTKAHYDAARAELARLRNNLEGERELRISTGRCVVEMSLRYDEACQTIDDLRASITELEAATVLAPRKCAPDCYRRGWDAAIDASCLQVMNETCTPGDILMLSDRIISAIHALTPLVDCGATCSPLKPDADIDTG